MAEQLNGKRVAALVTNGFEQVELLEPKRALEAEGAKVEVVSPEGEITLTTPNELPRGVMMHDFAVSEHYSIFMDLPLVFETTEAQIREIIAGCERVLAQHANTSTESASARFVAIGSSSLDIEVIAYFDTAEWNEFLVLRQEVLLALRRVVEEAGTSFAYPTQTVQLAGSSGRAGEPVSPAL